MTDGGFFEPSDPVTAMHVPPEAEREFTASALVVENGRVLLVDHPSLGRWVQPGGHVETGETPDEAAIREVREETGVVASLVARPSRGARRDGSVALPRPFSVHAYPVREDHWHVDFAYLATVAGRDSTTPAVDRIETGWFGPGELRAGERVDAHARRLALEALDRGDPEAAGVSRASLEGEAGIDVAERGPDG